MRRIVVIAIPHPEHPELFLHGLRRDNGKWALPGGHAKDGENLDEAARRELREETQLQVSKLEQVRNGQYPGDGEDLHVTLFHGAPTDFRASGEDDPDGEFLTFKYANPSDLVNCHVPKERNILIEHLGLAKGAVQRIAAFNPAHDVQPEDKEALGDWQSYGQSDSGYRPDEGEFDPKDIREGLSRMHQHANVRAMNKLMSMTKWRRNPDSGEREFLLHRGMSPEEYNTNVNHDEGVVHHKDQRSSWTPDYTKAKDFTKPDYLEDANIPVTSTAPDDEYKVVSAWIPESKIVHMPKMYGRTNYASRGRPHGENEYAQENEVIVNHNHRSQIHVEPPPNPVKQLHESLQHRQPGHVLGIKESRNAYQTAVNRALESVPKEKHAEVKAKLAQMHGVKLAASEQQHGETLEKMPKIFSPTKKKPYTTVVRIQNKEGHGPYTGGDIDELAEHGEPHMADRTPSPRQDPGFNEADHAARSSALNMDNPVKFGFENADQMHGWFHPHEIEAMAAHGFKPKKVKAAHVWSSGKQVFFQRYVEPRRAKKKMGLAKHDDLEKAMDPTYLKEAGAGFTVLVPVTVNGMKDLAPGVPHHITVKMFRKPGENLTSEFTSKIHDQLKQAHLPQPDPSKMQFAPHVLTSPRTGKTYYSLKVTGMPKEYYDLYDKFKEVGVTYPSYQPHITVDKETYDRLTSDPGEMRTLDVKIHEPELRHGATVLHTWKKPSGT